MIDSAIITPATTEFAWYTGILVIKDKKGGKVHAERHGSDQADSYGIWRRKKKLVGMTWIMKGTRKNK